MVGARKDINDDGADDKVCLMSWRGDKGCKNSKSQESDRLGLNNERSKRRRTTTADSDVRMM